MKRLGYRLLLTAIVLLFAYLSAKVRPPTQQTTLAPSEGQTEVTAESSQPPTPVAPASVPPASVPPSPSAESSAERESSLPSAAEAPPTDVPAVESPPSPATKKNALTKKPAQSAETPAKTTTKPAASNAKNSPVVGNNVLVKNVVVKNVVIKDLDGEVAYRGDIDLTSTLERIAAGRTLSFSHDGSTFQNRERRLPAKSAGYYREWVHPTPGLSGPGPQRVVTGKGGEVWYTHDHYRTFRKIR